MRISEETQGEFRAVAEESVTERRRVVDQVRAGERELAEDDDQRAVAFDLRTKRGGRETHRGGTLDFLSTAFLDEGATISRAVGRITAQRAGETELGTGAMVAPGILLTNQHVLSSRQGAASAIVEFNLVDDSRPERRPLRGKPNALLIADATRGWSASAARPATHHRRFCPQWRQTQGMAHDLFRTSLKTSRSLTMRSSALPLSSQPLSQKALYWAVLVSMLSLSLSLSAQLAHAQNVNLGNLGSQGFRIEGIDAGDSSGISVSGAGDVNGDGLADLIVGASGGDPNGNSGAGESYVVFGKDNNTTVDLSNLGTGGFRMDGIDALDDSGSSVSGAGDVNGDGLDDLIVGAQRADPNGDSEAGESYVVFGKADNTTVNLNALGNGGFRIDGIDVNDLSGISVSGAGDVNGDGLADLIVGAPNGDPRGVSNAGESYVIFGKIGSVPVDLNALGSGGFRMDGIDSSDIAGFSVSGAGDVNGDGLADLIVGAFGGNPNGTQNEGETYVVFGKTGSAAVNLGNLGNGGFRVDGVDTFEASGISASGAGDVNGDGLADLIIGASGDPLNAAGAEKVYVVFGKTGSGTVALGALGNGGFRMDGIDAGDEAGRSVSGAGDVNGDGLADLIVGALGADPGGLSAAGETYVVFGKADGNTVNLNTLGNGGFRIDGSGANDFSGRSVSGAGDVNGDGLADLIIGADGADPNADSSAGTSYVVFSAAVPLLSATYRGRAANGNPPRLAIGISGDGSNDSTPDSRTWIDFADGSAPLASGSTEIVTLTRNSGAFPNAASQVSWRVQSNRQNWSSASLSFRYLQNMLTIADEGRLQLVFSPNGAAPFTPLPSTLNTATNTISAVANQLGFFYLGVGPVPDQIFRDGFE